MHLFDANFNYINATTGDVNNTNFSAYYSEMDPTTVNQHTYLTSPSNVNDLLVTLNINKPGVKYAFVGAMGGNIDHMSFYNYVDYELNRVNANILPKRNVNSDGMTITTAVGLKVANVGQFVRNNSGTIVTDETGNYIVVGYVRTGGDDDAQTFATIKGLVV